VQSAKYQLLEAGKTFNYKQDLAVSVIIAGKIAVTVKNPYYKDPNSQECTFLTAKVSGLGSALKM
jgi:hypothetical protein